MVKKIITPRVRNVRLSEWTNNVDFDEQFKVELINQLVEFEYYFETISSSDSEESIEEINIIWCSPEFNYFKAIWFWTNIWYFFTLTKNNKTILDLIDEN